MERLDIMRVMEPGCIDVCTYCSRKFELGYPWWVIFPHTGRVVCPGCIEKYHPEWSEIIDDEKFAEYGGVMRNSEDPVTNKKQEKTKMRNEFEEAIYDAIKNLKELALELENEQDCTRESFKQKLYELSVWTDTAWSEYNRYWQAIRKEAVKEGVKALQRQGYGFDRITVDGFEFAVNDLGEVEEVDEIPFG